MLDFNFLKQLCVIFQVWFITREEFRSAIVQQDILQRQRKEILLFLNQVKSLEKLKKEDFKMLTTVSKASLLSKRLNRIYWSA